MNRINNSYLITLILICLGISLTACSDTPPHRYSFSPQTRHAPSSAVAIAKRQIGVPYHYGGASPARGFDCSGLVYYSYHKAGVNVPRTSTALYDSTFPVDPRALRTGDLLFFNIEGKISHVAMYVGEKRFIHAPSSGKRVSYASLDNPYWREHLVRAGRLF